MKYEVTAEYTEELAKMATRRFLAKFLRSGLMAWMVLLPCVVLLVSRGQRGWFVGAAGAVLVIA